MTIRATRILISAILLIIPGLASVCEVAIASEAETATLSHDVAMRTPAPTRAVTQHSGVFGGESLSYIANAGSVILRNAKNIPIASIFSVTYEKTPRNTGRPVMFIFNGGPGASAAYLELGALGPKRVVFSTKLDVKPKPPFPLISNKSSPLNVTDMVFIDPPQTGYSQSLPGDRTHQYATIDGDARIIAQFIRTWLQRNDRMASPKYLLGESYGATRAALVADLLSKANGPERPIAFNGIILIGQMLTVDDLGQRPLNAQGFAVRLPTMAAVAWHYGRVSHRRSTFKEFIARARLFALNSYLPALMRGRMLPRESRLAIASRMSTFIGLSTRTILKDNLKVTTSEFRRDLIPGHILGYYDARYSEVRSFHLERRKTAISEDLNEDPSWTDVNPVISGSIVDYLKDDLRVKSTKNYKTLNATLEKIWNFGPKFRAPASTWLVDAIKRNPSVFVLTASGYDDLATPFSCARYLMSELPLAPGHGWYRVYVGGHEFYTDQNSLRKFSQDLRDFVRASAGQH